MNPREQLARNLLEEAHAYGYTLTIWGVGALLVDRYGTPLTGEVLAYVGGAVAGFVFLAAVTFQDFAGPTAGENSLGAASVMHVGATFGNVALLAVLLAAVPDTVPATAAFAGAGFLASVVYNVALVAEMAASSVWN